MEDAFGVIVVIICVIAAVAKSRKTPPQRRGGRPLHHLPQGVHALEFPGGPQIAAQHKARRFAVYLAGSAGGV